MLERVAMLWMFCGLGLAAAPARADEPPAPPPAPAEAPPAEAPPAAAPPAEAPPAEAPPAAAPPAEAPPSPVETLRHLSEAARGLSGLAATVGADTASREAARLARTADSVAMAVDLGLELARFNKPELYTKYWSVTLGAGGARSPTDEAAGELAVLGGFFVTGPTCTLLEGSVRVSLSSQHGPSLAQYGRTCLGGIRPDITEEWGEGKEAELIAITAHESIGLNVRPSVDASAATDSRRFALASAGISVEGARLFWARRRWSIGFGSVSMGESALLRSVEGDLDWLTRLTAGAWFAELRYHRPPSALTDFAMRLFPFSVEQVHTGDSIGIISLAPLAISGFGMFGVYFDAEGGADITTEDEDDTPEQVAARPDLGIGSWRLAAHLGVARFHATVASRQRLFPTLDEGAVAERRLSASLHVDLRRVFLDAEAYRSRLRLFYGPGDDADAEHETWGVEGEAWVHVGRHLLVGASAEVGRSFVFGEPSIPGMPGSPAFGYLVLGQVGWRAGKTTAVKL